MIMYSRKDDGNPFKPELRIGKMWNGNWNVEYDQITNGGCGGRGFGIG